jgi:hypothetical protein
MLFPSEKLLAQSITYKNLIGPWEVEVGKGEYPGTRYDFKDSNTLFIILFLKKKTEVMKYSLDTRMNEQLLDFAPVNKDSIGISMFKIKQNNRNEMILTNYAVKLYNKRSNKWEERYPKGDFIMILKRLKD